MATLEEQKSALQGQVDDLNTIVNTYCKQMDDNNGQLTSDLKVASSDMFGGFQCPSSGAVADALKKLNKGNDKLIQAVRDAAKIGKGVYESQIADLDRQIKAQNHAAAKKKQ
jgi:hypothetical protein